MTLYLPENYNPSYSYPMLVQFYETHSQDLFVYHTPSPSAAMADIPTFVSQGYIVLCPIFILLLVTPERVATIPLSAE